MRSRFRIAIVFLAGLATAVSCRSRDSSPARLQPPRYARKLERLVSATMYAQKIPGLSMAVGWGDHRWSKGFGLADVENQVPVTPDTVFRLASICKAITAVAAMQLVEKGHLDLGAPIQRYVPTFPEKEWTLTARDLLSHQGGIRWYKGDEMASTRHYATVTDGLEMFKNDPLKFKPGTRYLYSSYGINLVGAAVEGASGQPYLDYVRTHIFYPAGMRGTRDDNCQAIILHRAAGYLRTKQGELLNSALSDTSNKLPGGGLCGTANDLVSFAVALDRGKLLRSETFARMTTVQRLPGGRWTGYALGWHVGWHKGIREVYHPGAQPRVSTMLYTRPGRHIAVALLCNLEGASLLELARSIADQLESER